MGFQEMLALPPLSFHRIFTTVPLEGGWEKGRDLTGISEERVEPGIQSSPSGETKDPRLGGPWTGLLGWIERKVIMSNPAGTHVQGGPYPCLPTGH